MSILDSRTFEDRFHERRPGLHWRLWRDVRLAAFLLAFMWRYATVGRRVRAEYRAKRERGEPFWLD